MQSEVIILSRPELSDIISQSIRLAVEDLRSELQASPDIVDKTDLSAHYGWSVSKINRLMKLGLPFEKVGTEHPQFRISQIDKWLSKNTKGKGSQPEIKIGTKGRGTSGAG